MISQISSSLKFYKELHDLGSLMRRKLLVLIPEYISLIQVVNISPFLYRVEQINLHAVPVRLFSLSKRWFLRNSERSYIVGARCSGGKASLR